MIVGFNIVIQWVMVEFLKQFASTERLDWGQWCAYIGIAALSWPIGWLFKCIKFSGKQLVKLRSSTFWMTSIADIGSHPICMCHLSSKQCSFNALKNLKPHCFVHVSIFLSLSLVMSLQIREPKAMLIVWLHQWWCGGCTAIFTRPDSPPRGKRVHCWELLLQVFPPHQT